MRRPLGQLRIIGGEWRSRRVEFDAGEGVRPTPDRVRQTAFDWLSTFVDGSCVLDLFAGSGALGLEALSRGAAHATFVDSGRAQCAAIRAALRKLEAESRAEVVQADAVAFLSSFAAGRPSLPPFDLVFIDPPYAANLLVPALAALPVRLAPTHRVYLEWAKGDTPPLPAGCSLLREKTAGAVSYGLAVFEPSGRPE